MKRKLNISDEYFIRNHRSMSVEDISEQTNCGINAIRKFIETLEVNTQTYTCKNPSNVTIMTGELSASLDQIKHVSVQKNNTKRTYNPKLPKK